jgi:hypothetical protein
MFGSQHTISETVEKIEAAATDVRLSVEKMNNFKVQTILNLIFKGIHVIFFCVDL